VLDGERGECALVVRLPAVPVSRRSPRTEAGVSRGRLGDDGRWSAKPVCHLTDGLVDRHRHREDRRVGADADGRQQRHPGEAAALGARERAVEPDRDCS
jgi:hypothetical protein